MTQRWTFGESLAGPMLGALGGLVVAYLLVRHGVASAAFVAALLPVAFVVLRYPAAGPAAAAGILVVIPYWWTFGSAQLSTPRLALVLAVAGLFAGTRRGLRFTGVDLLVLALGLLFVITWNAGLGVSRGILIETIVALSFYAVGRACGFESGARLVFWGLALGGAVGGLSVLYEYFVTHSPLVTNASDYAWQQEKQYIYRPGGLFGSPPGAATALAVTLVSTLPLCTAARGWRRVLALGCGGVQLIALVVTFTRAGWIAAAIGAAIYVVLSAPRVGRRVQVLVAALAVGAALALAVLPSVSGSELFQAGVQRGGTFSARQDYWRLALPVASDSARHLLVGRGFASLNGAQTGGSVDASLSSAPLLTVAGTHNQYVRTLVEQGLVGLVLLIAWLATTTAVATLAARRAAGELRRSSAALAGAIVAFATVSLADDTFRDSQSIALAALVAGLAVSLATARRARGAPQGPAAFTRG